ncbi:hypothetical protein [Streptomyces sp. Rer75]|uniref:DUF7144 family membrane protein n=1 Tax=unclassified Streptomyces TaxID=2593676 RepID=UPI0015CFF554|nr:hypothetical protein [Streptomyces sp. Rer75]QLH23027.1 hypothetical protein HYQ63_22350 [Streptomyces sp. Rer75]
MATHAGGVHPGTAPRARGGVSGRLVFGAVMMLFGGLMTLAQGIAAVRTDRVFVTTPSYIFSYSLGGWGWIHMILGVVLVVAGLATFTGAMWARTAGVVIAGLALIANFLWLPYTPLWATVLLLVDAFIIWALCTGGQGMEAGMARPAAMGGGRGPGDQGPGGQGPEPRAGGPEPEAR